MNYINRIIDIYNINEINGLYFLNIEKHKKIILKDKTKICM